MKVLVCSPLVDLPKGFVDDIPPPAAVPELSSSFGPVMKIVQVRLAKDAVVLTLQTPKMQRAEVTITGSALRSCPATLR